MNQGVTLLSPTLPDSISPSWRRLRRCFEKVQQCCLWRGTLAHIVVHKNEFVHLRMIESARRAHGSFGETQRLGRSVGVESRSFDVSSAGPESGADHLVRIRFAGNRICSVTLGCAPS